MQKWKRIGPDYIPVKTRFQETPIFSEGLYDLNNQVLAWMVPNGSWGESNAGLVLGKDQALLVDTLWDLRYTRGMLESMAPLLSKSPIRTVVNTHADGDHWWGNELLPDTEIVSSSAAREEMQHIKPISLILLGSILGKVLSTVGAKNIGHWFQQMIRPYAFGEISPRLPDRTFEGELRLDVGGRTVELIQVGPAHTMGDVLVHIPDARVLFCADILFVGSTPVMWAGPIENMFAALDKILSLDAEIFVPGHGPLADREGVKGVIAYWDYVNTEAGKRHRQGMSAQLAAREIVLSPSFADSFFSKWNSPERMMTNVHTLYRQWSDKEDAPKIPELLNVMRKQAQLAHLLPDAQPAVMRRK